MFSKFKKYIIGFFALAGGILFAFLSGKSAGRKKERLGGLNKKIKETKKSIKKTEKKKRETKKSLESKKKELDKIKKQRESFGVYDSTSSNAKDAEDFLKKFSKEKK
jgi:septal ring factor EnvC (AmiA/AmiB activator)